MLDLPLTTSILWIVDILILYRYFDSIAYDTIFGVTSEKGLILLINQNFLFDFFNQQYAVHVGYLGNLGYQFI